MYKKILIFIAALFVLSCNKRQQRHSACGTQNCTDIFVSVTIKFTDNTGKSINVQNFSAIDQKTHLSIVPAKPINQQTGTYVITDDSMLHQLSSTGDNILISATDPATNQIKTTTVNISGGCNCHVVKVSGSDTIIFD